MRGLIIGLCVGIVLAVLPMQDDAAKNKMAYLLIGLCAGIILAIWQHSRPARKPRPAVPVEFDSDDNVDNVP